ncbi:hypothetical protein PR048_007399 [Dryococelus australis]|uniref:Uncharacterized protein n=1 Tax=Dryococelus australis TaxID=614101 RepID=A0ABQ9HUE8_9NEOP|nr:hypothetical protein PR048_007399 [Dryococelus australis]
MNEEIWVTVNIEKWEIPEKTRRPAASSGTIPTCENPGATPPEVEIEPCSPRSNHYTIAAPVKFESSFAHTQDSTSRKKNFWHVHSMLKPREQFIFSRSKPSYLKLCDFEDRFDTMRSSSRTTALAAAATELNNPSPSRSGNGLSRLARHVLVFCALSSRLDFTDGTESHYCAADMRTVLSIPRTDVTERGGTGIKLPVRPGFESGSDRPDLCFPEIALGYMNGTLDILIADTAILDYYRATDHGCKLQKIGDAINEDTYAVGMTKGFPLKVLASPERLKSQIVEAWSTQLYRHYDIATSQSPLCGNTHQTTMPDLPRSMCNSNMPTSLLCGQGLRYARLERRFIQLTSQLQAPSALLPHLGLVVQPRHYVSPGQCWRCVIALRVHPSHGRLSSRPGADVSVEQCRNERTGETGDPRENLPISSMVQHDFHLRKFGVDRQGLTLVCLGGRRAVRPLRHRGPVITECKQVHRAEPDLPWRSRLVRHRSGMRETLDLAVSFIRAYQISDWLREALRLIGYCIAAEGSLLTGEYALIGEQLSNMSLASADTISAVISKYSNNGYMDILQQKWYGALPCFKMDMDIAQPRPLGVAAVAGESAGWPAAPSVITCPSVQPHTSHCSRGTGSALDIDVFRADEGEVRSRENPPTNGIVQHYPHMLKSGSEPAWKFFIWRAPKSRYANVSTFTVMCALHHASGMSGVILAIVAMDTPQKKKGLVRGKRKNQEKRREPGKNFATFAKTDFVRLMSNDTKWVEPLLECIQGRTAVARPWRRGTELRHPPSDSKVLRADDGALNLRIFRDTITEMCSKYTETQSVMTKNGDWLRKYTIRKVYVFCYSLQVPRRNARAEEVGDPRGNTQTSDIVTSPTSGNAGEEGRPLREWSVTHLRVFLLLGLGVVMGCLILLFEHLFYRYTLPILRHKPKGTIWRSRNIMFFSQKLYRFINCVELVSPHHAARELVHTLRQGQITSLFQKSVKRVRHKQAFSYLLPHFLCSLLSLIRRLTDLPSPQIVLLRRSDVSMEEPEYNDEGNGKSPRKPADQRHSPTRFPLAKIRE